METEATYIGDAVYVRRDQYGRVVLTTESHLEAEAGNVVVLEEEVLCRLLDWVAGMFGGAE